jgi:hypothetical protein
LRSEIREWKLENGKGGRERPSLKTEIRKWKLEKEQTETPQRFTVES